MLSGIHACAYCKSKNYDGQIMSNDKSRAAFEAHIDDCIESEVGLAQALVKDGFGDYCVTWVASKWSAWQASREVALEQAAQSITEPIGYDNYTAMSEAAMTIRNLK
jgi:hypothetical protein